MKNTKNNLYREEQIEIMKKILEHIGINKDNNIFNREDLEKDDFKNKIDELIPEIKKYYKIASWNSYKYGINKHINLLKNICKYNDIIIDKMQKTKKDNNNTEKKYIHYVVYRFNIPEIFI
jgi:hypothetical protein